MLKRPQIGYLNKLGQIFAMTGQLAKSEVIAGWLLLEV